MSIELIAFIAIASTAMLIALGIQFYKYYKRSQLKQEQLEQEVEAMEKRWKKEHSSRKSGEVRLGFVAEKLAPFLEQFNHDPRMATFIGNPIDYIVFNDEKKEVTFIEVKSGESRLSKKQKAIKKAVENKSVTWETMRISNQK